MIGKYRFLAQLWLTKGVYIYILYLVGGFNPSEKY